MGGNGSLMGPPIWEEKKSWSLVLSKGTRMQDIEVEIQKKIGSAYSSTSNVLIGSIQGHYFAKYTSFIH